MIIAIMGGDGCGKTTIAQYIFQALKREKVCIELRRDFEEYFILKYPLKILKDRRKRIAKRLFFDNNGTVTWMHKLWALLVYMDQLALYMWVRLFKQRRTIIFDRYAFDWFIGWKYYRYLTPLVDWLYRHYPRPDLGIMLRASAEVAYKRKSYQSEYRGPQYQLNFFKFQVTEHDKLAKESNFIIVDTGHDLDTTKTKILELVRTFLESRNIRCYE